MGTVISERPLVIKKSFPLHIKIIAALVLFPEPPPIYGSCTYSFHIHTTICSVKHNAVVKNDLCPINLSSVYNVGIYKNATIER